jgi:hypothetical protein
MRALRGRGWKAGPHCSPVGTQLYPGPCLTAVLQLCIWADMTVAPVISHHLCSPWVLAPCTWCHRAQEVFGK